MVTILFLGASPTNTVRLRLDEEVRSIKEKLLSSEQRDKFRVEQEWAVRVGDLQGHLLRHKPHIVHFSGHGSTRGEIVLEDNKGESKTVPKEALKALFEILKDNIRCVVLNACYSEAQAKAIAESSGCVVGMSTEISDEAAISFASSFYQALGFGRSVAEAFALGRNQILMEGLPEEHTPQLITANGLDANKVYLTTVEQSNKNEQTSQTKDSKFSTNVYDSGKVEKVVNIENAGDITIN